jgi:transcriptional regulator with XRE-family HTH domain
MGKKERGTGFAAALKRLREEAGLSQAALAEKAGMNVFGVAKLEQGVREPGWATVLKLAAALGVECTAFCEEVSQKGRRK